MAFVAHKT